ncbi:MAG: DnaJ domain-containing protein [Myxococcota bacterium]|jgi:tetratricopeptide (TPR) repeat protein|nr:DnaJ domain-containing protein [Myxococcota bacterium]
MSEMAVFEEFVLELVEKSARGGIDARRGKKRWLFFFDEGELVCTQSNLKSEQDAAMREELGENASTRELNQAQAARRMASVCRAKDVKWEFHEGVRPPRRTEQNVRTALLQAMAQARDEAQLKAATATMLEAWPKKVGAISNLGAPVKLQKFFENLNGQKRGEQLLEDAPVDQNLLLAGLWIGWKLGLLEPGEEPVVGPGGLDILSIIAEELERLGPGDEAEESSLAEEEVDDTDAEDAAPDAEATGEEAEGSQDDEDEKGEDEKGEDDPDAPEAHPLEARLKELVLRAEAAETHFQFFDISHEADSDAFQSAYTSLARDLHPDRYTNAPPELQELATQVFDRLRQAWEDLGEDDARKKYTDKVIHGIKSEEDLAMEKVQAFWEGEAEYKRGIAAFNAGRMVQAHGFFQKAVELVPHELEFRAYLGFTKFKLNRERDEDLAEEGREMLKDVLEQNKEQDRKLDIAWLLMGRTYMEEENYDIAKRMLIRALKINPENSEAQKYLRRLEKTKKEKEDSEKGLLGRMFGRKK